MSLQPLHAYQRTREVAEGPRAAEHRLLGQITAELVAARESGLTGAALMRPLHRNREVWQVFAVDCSMPGNGLPPALKGSIRSISAWVDRHISLVMAGEEAIDDLIEVNRTVMEGLMGTTRQKSAA